jgi:hypothetical protein
MNTERIENIASLAAGAAAAVFFTLLFIAMSTPAAETVSKFLA